MCVTFTAWRLSRYIFLNLPLLMHVGGATIKFFASSLYESIACLIFVHTVNAWKTLMMFRGQFIWVKKQHNGVPLSLCCPVWWLGVLVKLRLCIYTLARHLNKRMREEKKLFCKKIQCQVKIQGTETEHRGLELGRNSKIKMFFCFFNNRMDVFHQTWVFSFPALMLSSTLEHT